jgi:hypothetical protein
MRRRRNERHHHKERVMGTCDVCGNTYDKAFTLTQGDRSGTFDSFECAIHAFAPVCAHCGVRIIGHGNEADGRFYCCANCASHDHVEGITDRV